MVSVRGCFECLVFVKTFSSFKTLPLQTLNLRPTLSSFSLIFVGRTAIKNTCRMCFFIILRYGPNPLNPLKRCLGLRTAKLAEDVEWGIYAPESSRVSKEVEWQTEWLSFGDACRLLQWLWTGRRMSVDDKERQALLMCDCCGDAIVIVNSLRRCSC